jgi:type IV pilus assembly protein PilY1
MLNEGGGRLGEAGVVFISGGVRTEEDEGDLTVGCGLYVVRASDGRLIRWLTPNPSSTDIECVVDAGVPQCDYDPLVHDCQMVGTPLALGSLPGDITTRVFVGDSQGRLYRADMSSADPRDWTLDPFFDLFDDPVAGGPPPIPRQPIFEAPAAAIDHRGLVTLIIGSGDPDDLESTPINRMASISEMFDQESLFEGGGGDMGDTCHLSWRNIYNNDHWAGSEFVTPLACAGDGPVFPWSNWLIEFTNDETPRDSNLDGGGPNAPFVQGERLLGAPVVFDNIVYFTTFVPSGDDIDCCAPGHGRILGVHYIGDTTADNLSDTSDVVRDLANDELSIEVAELGDNEVAFGVSVTRRPSCSDITEEGFPDFASARPAEYQLTVHNNSRTNDPGGAAPVDGVAEPLTGFEELNLATPPIQCSPDSWISLMGF